MKMQDENVTEKLNRYKECTITYIDTNVNKFCVKITIIDVIEKDCRWCLRYRVRNDKLLKQIHPSYLVGNEKILPIKNIIKVEEGWG